MPRSKAKASHTIGVISDTHGLLRPQAIAALQGSELILHAGDVGTPEILQELRKIAPVIAVRGNVDRGDWAASLPMSHTLELHQRRIHIVHNRDMLELDPVAEGLDVVVFGHSHRPTQETKRGVLWFNPGSAGRRRFSLPICLGRLILENGPLEDGQTSGRIRSEIVGLEPLSDQPPMPS